MDIRLLIAGLNVIAASLIIGVYGWAIGSPQLVGTAGSIGLVGAVLVALGLSYGEPTAKFLRDYISVVSRLHTKVLEDLRLSSVLPRVVAVEGGGYMVVYTTAPRLPDRLQAGVSIVDGSPLLAIRAPMLYTYGERLSAEDTRGLEDVLRRVFVENYGVCSRVTVRSAGSRLLEVRAEGVSGEIRDMVREPINPLDTLLTTIIAQATGRSIAVKSRSFEHGVYMLRLEVGG